MPAGNSDTGGKTVHTLTIFRTFTHIFKIMNLFKEIGKLM
jgi:hypothetical protein